MDKHPGSRLSRTKDIYTAKDLTDLWRCMTLALKGRSTAPFSAAKLSLVEADEAIAAALQVRRITPRYRHYQFFPRSHDLY